MALRFVSVLLCTIIAIGSAIAIPPPPPTGECGQNARRQTCGSACAPTCANPNPGPTCVLPCIDGCFCEEGYLKAANGVCVRPQECDSVPHIPNMQIPQFNAPPPPKCGEDEEYRTCGSACIPTCAIPLPRPWCTRQCAVGCYCKEGYLRNEENVCVPATRCKSAANGPNNIPLQKIPLTPTGSNPMLQLGPGPVIMPQSAPGSINIPLHKVQSESGPVNDPFPIFEPGPVILSHPILLGPGPVILPTPHVPFLPLGPGPVIFPPSNEVKLGPISIPLQKVPMTLCPINEEYKTCGVQLDCLASCKMPMTPKCMERMCTPGCVCQHPLVRHSDGRCVEKTECQKN